jgi:hypothetical protein
MNYAPDDLERCPDHPDALVRRIFDRTTYTLNQVETRTLHERTVGYECSECCRQLRILGHD